jgi:hypothetical protein
MSITAGGASRFTQVDDGSTGTISLTTNESTVIGYEAARLNFGVSQSTIVGYQAQSDGPAGDRLVLLGTRAGRLVQEDGVVGIGAEALEMARHSAGTVAVGDSAMRGVEEARGSVAVGAAAGSNLNGDGNVAIGNRAGASVAADTVVNRSVAVGEDSVAYADGAVALGAGAGAGGLDSLAAGADAHAAGRWSAAVGAGASTAAGASNSIAVGRGVSSGAPNQLLLAPTRNGAPYASAAEGELNVFGVLTGRYEPCDAGDDRHYSARVSAAVVELSNDHSSVRLGHRALDLSSSCNVRVLSPLSASAGATVTGEPLRALSGLEVAAGGATFSAPAMFLSPSNEMAGLHVTGLAPARVHGGLAVTHGDVVIEEGRLVARGGLEAASLTVQGGATFEGAVSFPGGLDWATIDLPADASFENLAVTESLSAPGAAVDLDGAAVSMEGSDLVHSGGAAHFADGLSAGGECLLESVSAASVDAGSLVATSAAVSEVLAMSPGAYVSGVAEFRGQLRASDAAACNLHAEHLRAPRIESERLSVNDQATIDKAVIESLVVHGETLLDGSMLSVAGTLSLDSVDVSGSLTSSGVAVFNTVQVYDRVLTSSLDTSNLDAAGDARVGGALTVSGAITASAFDCDNIECDTILVKGQNTLTVLGGSKLNTATAYDVTTEFLTVTDTCAFSNYVVIGGDLYVENECSASTVVAREVLHVPAGGEARVDGALEVSGSGTLEVLAGGSLACAGAASFTGPSSFSNAYFEESRARVAVALDAHASNFVGHSHVGELGAFSNLSGGSLSAESAAAGSLGACNLDVQGHASAGSAALGSLAVDGATDLRGDVLVGGDLTVSGIIIGNLQVGFDFDNNAVFSSRVTFQDGLVAVGGVHLTGDLAVSRDADFAAPVTFQSKAYHDDCVVLRNPQDPTRAKNWSLCVHPDQADPSYSELRINSWLGTGLVLTEDFDPGVLNFTGQHRCAIAAGQPAGGFPPGTLVRATGRHRGLDGSRRPSVDESLPEVERTLSPMDPAAFGVVSRIERQAGEGGFVFSLGSLRWPRPAPPDGMARAVVNSCGEGGVLVCGEGGEVRNGDLLCSSGTPGVAMRQGCHRVMSYTVGKATSEATDFSKGAVLVGCTYKF